jgi:hypothetical protein
LSKSPVTIIVNMKLSILALVAGTAAAYTTPTMTFAVGKKPVAKKAPVVAKKAPVVAKKAPIAKKAPVSKKIAAKPKVVLKVSEQTCQ